MKTPVLALCAMLLTACARPAPPVAPPAAPADTTWASPLGREHPLAGHAYDVDARRWLTEDELVAALRDVPVVLVGERHDNPDHHWLQARLVARLAGPDRAVAFEMIETDLPVAGVMDPDAAAAAAGWETSGWPAFTLYRPIFEQAHARGAPLVPAHPPRERVMAVSGQGIVSLDPAERADLGLDRPLSGAHLAALHEEISVAHCGYLDAVQVTHMAEAQQLKDAWMARAIGDGPALLIAGSGHTRRDRGVPRWLTADAATVELVEVQDGVTDPQAYRPVAEGAVDYAWFTARWDDQDPCEAFQEQLEAMRGGE